MHVVRTIKRDCDAAARFFAYRLGRVSCKYYGEVADGPTENEQNSGQVDASKVNASVPEITNQLLFITIELRVDGTFNQNLHTYDGKPLA